MKNKMKLNRIILALVSVPMLCGCDGLFEPKLTGEVSDERMWEVPDMAQGVLMKAYADIPSTPDSFSGNFLDAATDNAVTNSFNAAIYRLGLGSVTASNPQLSVWSQCYDRFQDIHIFLEKGLTDKTKYDLNEAVDQKKKLQLEAEAYYLRAWWGFYLLQYHGGRTADGQALGYPIVTKFITPEVAANLDWVKRNTYEECVEQICNDCDRAAAALPVTASGQWVGRATATMAEFLKTRVLLYAASPAYQPSDIVSIDGMGKFTVVDDAKYREKWERAARQAWKMLSVSDFGEYAAMQKSDMVDVADNNVMPSIYVSRYYSNSNGMESRHFPPFYYGSCNTAPSQNLVDAYPMKENGYPISHPESGYDKESPYEGRDNRFDLTVYHHDSQFGDNDSRIDVIYGGKDSESFMSGGSRVSRTGYYLAKFMSSKPDMLNPIQKQNSIHLYAPMRKAEIFFAFAEASNEVWGPVAKGPDMDKSAYDIIKDIRKKSGGIENDLYIETVKGDAASFRKLIMNERRLEFAFENMRFWDLRRCLLPLDETIYGVTVTREKGPEGETIFRYDLERKVEERPLNELKYYYLPVPHGEILKNPQVMINNLGY